jgi:hypothetical protein
MWPDNPAPAASVINLAGAGKLPDGSFQFQFTNTPGALFTVLTATNLAASPASWTPLGGPMEVSPGQFQFTDAQAGTNARAFYRVQSP